MAFGLNNSANTADEFSERTRHPRTEHTIMADPKVSFPFAEADVKRLAENPQALAAIDAYALGLIPLGYAEFLAEPDKDQFMSEEEWFGRHRLFHEVATRISDGRVPVPPDLRERYPSIYDARQRPPAPYAFVAEGSPVALMFKDLSRPAEYERYLGQKRDQFTEDDVQALIADERFLASMHAYASNRVRLGDVIVPLYGTTWDLPRTLSVDAFYRLTQDIARRIRAGYIAVPANLEQKYPEAYIQDPEL